MTGGESAFPEDVFRLRSDVEGADGIILGTPEYHGSFRDVPKNALDLMGFDESEGKRIGLVGVSGGGAPPEPQSEEAGPHLNTDNHETHG